MASPVLSVQKHTLTINATTTSVNDMVFTADTPPNVQLTSALGNLPSMVVGERFRIADHDSHNGSYEVVTVTTDQEDYLVKSINGATGNATSEIASCNQNVSAMANLTGTPATDTSDCVPFTMTRVTTISSNNADSFTDYLVNTDFVSGSPNRVRVTREGDDPTENAAVVVCEVTVVEFDSTYVNVYSAQETIDATDVLHTVTDAFGGGPVTVDLSKAWLYFTYNTIQGADLWRSHALRGEIKTTSTLEFNKSQPQGTDQIFNWWVVECKNTEWAVQAKTITVANLATTNTASLTAVDLSKTWVLGSREGADSEVGDDGDQANENLVDISFDSTTVLRATRQTSTGGLITWSGFVIEFASGGNENVYRGTLSWTVSETSKTNVPIGATVTTADSMVHLCGHLGHFAGGHWKDTTNSSDRAPDAFTAWTFTNSTNLTVTHSTNSTADDDQDLTWEVIEWDVGGAAPTRRVMVVS